MNTRHAMRVIIRRELRARRKSFVVSTAIIVVVVAAAMVALGLTYGDTVRRIRAGITVEDGNLIMAGLSVVILYGTLLGYGQVILTGVVEEKSNRVVEVLLGAMHPHHFLAAKVAAIGLLGFVQVGIVAMTVTAIGRVSGSLELPPASGSAMLTALLWFILGYAFYGCGYAAAGSLVGRPTDAASAGAPFTIVIIVGWATAWISLVSKGADSIALQIASLVPPLAPLTMPMRMVQAAASPWEVAVSIAGMLVAVYGLIRLAGRVYMGAILRGGLKVKWREAWRSSAM